MSEGLSALSCRLKRTLADPVRFSGCLLSYSGSTTIQYLMLIKAYIKLLQSRINVVVFIINKE